MVTRRWDNMPQANPLRTLEEDIARVKGDLHRLSRQHAQAFAAGRRDEATETRVLLMETELKNIGSIVSYIGAVSPAAAREIGSRQKLATSRFEALRKRPDPASLQDWVKRDLAPLLGRTEQVAYLVASSLRFGERSSAAPFVWKLPDR